MMAKSLVLMTLVATLCLACGVAEQVDEVVGASRTPQATARPRSCPEFGWWLMSPKAPSVGAPAEIRVDVSDRDTPLDALSLEWSAASGSFSEPAAANTSFTCEREGHQALALVARDDTDCARQLDIQITCFPR
jgi:hypothetical protein